MDPITPVLISVSFYVSMTIKCNQDNQVCKYIKKLRYICNQTWKGINTETPITSGNTFLWRIEAPSKLRSKKNLFVSTFSQKNRSGGIFSKLIIVPRVIFVSWNVQRNFFKEVRRNGSCLKIRFCRYLFI